MLVDNLICDLSVHLGNLTLITRTSESGFWLINNLARWNETQVTQWLCYTWDGHCGHERTCE